MSLLGFGASDHWCLFAVMPDGLLATTIASWKIGSASPTPAQQTMADLAHRSAKIAAGIIKTETATSALAPITEPKKRMMKLSTS
eukprot:6048993-Amphidinium_carterae.1